MINYIKNEIIRTQQNYERVSEIASRVPEMKAYFDRQLDGILVYKNVLEGILKDLEA